MILINVFVLIGINKINSIESIRFDFTFNILQDEKKG